MKKYIKPTIEILELRVNENLALKYNNLGDGLVTPVTKYNMANASDTPGMS